MFDEKRIPLSTKSIVLIFMLFSIFNVGKTSAQNIIDSTIVYELPYLYEKALSKQINKTKNNKSYLGFKLRTIETRNTSISISLEQCSYEYQYGYIYGVSYIGQDGYSHYNEYPQRILLDSKRYILVNNTLYPILLESDKYSATGNFFRFHLDYYGRRDSLYSFYVNTVIGDKLDTVIFNISKKYRHSELKKNPSKVYKKQHLFRREPNNEIIYVLPDSVELLLYDILNQSNDHTFLKFKEINPYGHYKISIMKMSSDKKSDEIKGYTNRFLLIHNNIYPLFFDYDFVLSHSLDKFKESLATISTIEVILPYFP